MLYNMYYHPFSNNIMAIFYLLIIYIMKLKAIHIVLIIILFAGVLMLTTSDTVVPYSADTLFSNMYKYEGMTSNSGKTPFELHIDQNLKPPAPLTAEEFNKMSGSSKSPENATKPPVSPPAVKQSGSSSKLVEGFALQPSPLNVHEPLDRFGSTLAGPQCFGKGSGYSKSLGPLCLSGEDLRMLTTRGGNISGNDSTIGR